MHLSRSQPKKAEHLNLVSYVDEKPCWYMHQIKIPKDTLNVIWDKRCQELADWIVILGSATVMNWWALRTIYMKKELFKKHGYRYHKRIINRVLGLILIWITWKGAFFVRKLWFLARKSSKCALLTPYTCNLSRRRTKLRPGWWKQLSWIRWRKIDRRGPEDHIAFEQAEEAGQLHRAYLV